MKFFNLKKNKTQQTDYFGFSTPFLKIGKGNLSLPSINKYYTQNGIVRFGNDNLYPQLLNQMYYTSAIHGACIDFISNAIIGGGYELTEFTDLKDKIEFKTFDRINKISKLAKDITRDFIIHRRICIIVTKSADNKITKLKRIDPSTVRNSADNTKFVYSSDWSTSQKTKSFERYSITENQKESMYVYQDSSPGQDIYPIPSYNSILNYCFLDGEQSFFHKSNIQNSVFPSLVIRRPKNFSSIEELDNFKKSLESRTGAKDSGKILVLTGSGIDDTPQIDQLTVSNNDKMFETTAKEIKESIAIAHKINPSIMGVKVAGSLGNAQELTMSYQIFEKNVVIPDRQIIQEILNDLLHIGNIESDLTINNYQIIGGELKDTTEEKKK